MQKVRPAVAEAAVFNVNILTMTGSGIFLAAIVGGFAMLQAYVYPFIHPFIAMLVGG